MHAGMLPALAGTHPRLRNGSWIVGGAGRIGSAVVRAAHEGGVGYTVTCDGQLVAPEQVGPCASVRMRDIGQPKVAVLERFLDGRPHGVCEGICAPIESAALDPHIAGAALCVWCPNTLTGRLAGERKAVAAGVPSMQVAAFDGRERWGGLITLWLPGRDLACFGCVANPSAPVPRGEGLVPSLTTALAAIAVTLGVQLVTGCRDDAVRRHNLFYFDAERFTLEAFAVERLADCAVCGGS
jgi:molybdopterin/thiamine biosynthesis adenylyltransferase